MRYRRNSRRGYGRENKDSYKWSRPIPGNVNHHYELSEGAWNIWQVGDPIFGSPTRVFQINASDTSEDDPNPSVFVKRVVFDLGFHANVTKVATAGGRVNFDRVARDDIPAPGPFYNVGSDNVGGALVDGDFATSTRQGAQSWLEGISVCWALMYEDTAQVASPLAADEGGYFDPNEPKFVEKNKTIFKRGMFQVAAYKPYRLQVKHAFTGRGVQLLPGSREVNQITFAMWAWAPGGTNVPSQIAMVPADARYQYLDND